MSSLYVEGIADLADRFDISQFVPCKCMVGSEWCRHEIFVYFHPHYRHQDLRRLSTDGADSLGGSERGMDF